MATNTKLSSKISASATRRINADIKNMKKQQSKKNDNNNNFEFGFREGEREQKWYFRFTIENKDSLYYKQTHVLEFILSYKIDDIEYRYPFHRPKVRFVTKVWHANISVTSGHICMNILGSDWSPALKPSAVVESIKALLDDPEPSSPLNAVAGDSYNKSKISQIEKESYQKKITEFYEQGNNNNDLVECLKLFLNESG